MRLIRISCHSNKVDAIVNAIKKAAPIDWVIDNVGGPFEKSIEIITADGRSQQLIDDVQSIFTKTSDWRLVVLPIETILPREQFDLSPAQVRKRTSREELYESVSRGCDLNSDFIIFTVLSSIVATIGLNLDSVAIVIAAMVIAPLLSPIVGFSLGSALGDIQLMLKAIKTSLIGFFIGAVVALLLVQLMGVNVLSNELQERTVLSPWLAALALAAGAAAALSLSTGISSALVGVMVAVAFLPPSVAAVMFAGAGELDMAASAAIILALNIVCALLSAQVVFVIKGVRPRTRDEKKIANWSVTINLLVWAVLLLLLLVLMSHITV